jgi:hypothetical protein
MTRRDVEIIADLIVQIIAAVERAKQSGPLFNLEREIDRAVEAAAAQTEA